MATESTVLVMAKAPVPGRVKTRLCPPCTPEQAAAIAEAALADTLDAVALCGADRRVVALDGAPGPWLPVGFEVVAQVGSTFADRLDAAWSTMTGPTLQIGMDTPQVDAGLLDDGLDRLTREQAVLGLATDGGWWGLGLRRPVPDLFVDVPMSTDHTGAAQIAALNAHGIEPALLRPLRDIDTIDDAVAVAATIPRSRTAARVAEVMARSMP
jgi:rSAM/selenodomain-associated transferase 1